MMLARRPTYGNREVGAFRAHGKRGQTTNFLSYLSTFHAPATPGMALEGFDIHTGPNPGMLSLLRVNGGKYRTVITRFVPIL
jgi:hypothetical protein